MLVFYLYKIATFSINPKTKDMVTYKEILPSEVSIIKELWIRNRDYHAAMEPHFKSQYLNLSFESRMQSLFASKQKQYKITVAAQNDTVVGYCISEYENGEGEVVSLHVLETLRGQGIGKQLLSRHVSWLKQNGCCKIGLYVASENQKTIDFYKANGFLSNLTYMQIP